jgi:hypothetical protein
MDFARPWPTAAPWPHASRLLETTNRLCFHPAAMSGASRQRRCRAQRARYATHDSEQPAGRVRGTSSGRGNESSRRAVTTGDSVGSSTVSCPPWRKRLQLWETRTKSQSPRGRHTCVSTSSGRSSISAPQVRPRPGLGLAAARRHLILAPSARNTYSYILETVSPWLGWCCVLLLS